MESLRIPPPPVQVLLEFCCPNPWPAHLSEAWQEWVGVFEELGEMVLDCKNPRMLGMLLRAAPPAVLRVRGRSVAESFFDEVVSKLLRLRWRGAQVGRMQPQHSPHHIAAVGAGGQLRAGRRALAAGSRWLCTAQCPGQLL